MTVTLNRIYLSHATLGVWSYPDNPDLYSVERPWQDNQPFISCIPEGTYLMQRRNSPRFGPDMWEIAHVEGRSHILIHVANYADNVQGCIGLGMSMMNHLEGVGSSKKAIEKFYDWSKDADFLEITITSGIKAL